MASSPWRLPFTTVIFTCAAHCFHPSFHTAASDPKFMYRSPRFAIKRSVLPPTGAVFVVFSA
jgi:hypothetical protein